MFIRKMIPAAHTTYLAERLFTFSPVAYYIACYFMFSRQVYIRTSRNKTALTGLRIVIVTDNIICFI